MPALSSHLRMLRQIGGLVVQEVDTLDDGGLLRERSRVGAVCEASRLPRLVRRVRAADGFTILADDVLAALQRTDFRKGELIARQHMLPHVERRLLLPEKEAEGLDTMIQGEGEDLERLGVVNLLKTLHFQGNVSYLETHAFPVVGEEELEYGPERHRRVYIKGRGPRQHTHCRKQAEDAEHVVPVDVRDEDGIYLHRRHTEALELHLHPLAAID